RGHRSPTRDDIYDAAELALAHRARARIRREQESQSPSDEAQRREGEDEQRQEGETAQPGASESNDDAGASEQEVSQADTGQQAAGAAEGVASGSSGGTEAVPDASEMFALKKIELQRKRAPRKEAGKRAATKSPDRRGRYVRAQTQGKLTDPAGDATVPAAAPHQGRIGRQAGQARR